MVQSSMDIGTCSYVLRGHIGVVRCLNFKGNILISGGDRKRIIAWNTEVRRKMIMWIECARLTIGLLLSCIHFVI